MALRCVFVFALVVVSTLAFSAKPPELTMLISDKLNHLAAFFALAALLDQTARNVSFWRVVVIWLLAYGLWIECVQGWLSYREASLLDVGADAIGICLYGLVRTRIVHLLARFVRFA
ncbi:Hypothetical protein HDN1F_33040 [gamma proteobacterium HdN1]|nr:Hypothetical protein HDN1F_33040 [gamma proteobacterium HdN1]